MQWVFRLLLWVWILGGSFTVPAMAAYDPSWQVLKPGLEYKQIRLPAALLHAFRVDLSRYQLNLVFASDLQRDLASVRQFANYSSAAVAINGGFFDLDDTPLGLRVDHGTVHFPIRDVSWWPVLLVQNQRAHIIPRYAYRHSSDMEFAIQAGPRLLQDGVIPRGLKEDNDARTAVAIDAQGRLLMVISQGVGMTTKQLAQALQRPETQGGLGCVQAMNLDGGSSTQLYARVDRFHLHIPSFADVADAVVVLPRS